MKPQTLEEEGVLFEKEDISFLEFNLYNLVRCLKEAFKGLEGIRGKTAVLVIGNACVGKSTMISSLVFGCDSLEMVKNQ